MNQQTVLLVEDNLVLAKIYAEILGTTDRTVTVTHNGRDAKTHLDQYTPDLLIIDLHIPEVSGMQIIQEVTADARFTNTKIIVTTADSFLGNKIQTWHPRVNKVLIKPVSIEKLLKEL